MCLMVIDFSSFRKYRDLEKHGPFLKDKVYKLQVKQLVLVKFFEVPDKSLSKIVMLLLLLKKREGPASGTRYR